MMPSSSTTKIASFVYLCCWTMISWNVSAWIHNVSRVMHYSIHPMIGMYSHYQFSVMHKTSPVVSDGIGSGGDVGDTLGGGGGDGQHHHHFHPRPRRRTFPPYYDNDA